jgi:acetate kinase
MMQKTHHILCLNSGSSSLKFALFRIGEKEEALLARGEAERIGISQGRFWLSLGKDAPLKEEKKDFSDHERAVEETFANLHTSGLPVPDAIGHRVVHGGPHYNKPAKVDEKLLSLLRQLIPFAPLHLPSEILCIESVAKRFPDLSQVACFDTAFHRRMPEIAQRFPLPRVLWNEGVRRYGFHGLSYEYIMDALGPKPPGRVIIAHLGNGASMAAVLDGSPIDTTMGFTPAGGFMMGTRPGDLDPGIIIHLLREKKMNGDELNKLINDESGLLGVSQLSPDMKTLLYQRESNLKAAQAIEMFCYQARKYIGAMAAALGGLDLLVFTGGIGERAAPVRSEICRGLAHLGIELNDDANERHDDTITIPTSACRVRVIPTNEDVVIARHTHRLISC